MEHYLNFNRMKALYILILRSLLRKFDIGANKRQSIFYTIAGIGSRQISTKNHPPLRTGQTSGLDSVHIGTIRKILSSWWLHIKLTHSRMSVGYHEWPGILFIGVWRASACSPGRELCCLDGETRNSAHAQKKPILVLWMQFSFLRFKLKEEPLTYTGIATQCWKAVASKKLLPSIATDMHFLSHCGYFSHGLLRW